MAKIQTRPEAVRVVLSRPMSMGPEVTLPIGALLGEVTLAEGVSLGFFSHALFHGVAGEEPAAPKEQASVNRSGKGRKQDNA